MRAGSRRALLPVTLALAGSCLVACSDDGGEVEVYEPSEVEEVEGSDIGIVTFTAIGAEAVGLETEVAEQVGDHTVVDYAALIYDGQGESWVYTVTSELTYQRAAVVVDRIEAGKVLISSGLDPGTEVVTTGVAEVYGTELHIGGSH